MGLRAHVPPSWKKTSERACSEAATDSRQSPAIGFFGLAQRDGIAKLVLVSPGQLI